MSHRVSVRDVAAESGVSVASVSRVLNSSGYASQSVRKRVLDAVEKLGYEPDFTARLLRTGKSRTIGYLLPSIANPFLAAQLSEVELLARQIGYSLLVGSSESQARDRELVAFFENRRLDGIIALPNHEYPDCVSCPFTKSKLPVVIIDRDMGSEFDSVLVDHYRGISHAMEYLLSIGHCRIAMLVSSENSRPGREKLRGYRAALESARIPFDPALVYTANLGIGSSRSRMEQMLNLDVPPTAIIAIGTQLLSGAIRVIREANMDIPRDISVIGIGTLEALELMWPPVTALRYDSRAIAQIAIRLMMERISSDATPIARKLFVAYDLIMGKSCGPPPTGDRLARSAIR